MFWIKVLDRKDFSVQAFRMSRFRLKHQYKFTNKVSKKKLV